MITMPKPWRVQLRAGSIHSEYIAKSRSNALEIASLVCAAIDMAEPVSPVVLTITEATS